MLLCSWLRNSVSFNNFLKPIIFQAGTLVAAQKQDVFSPCVCAHGVHPCLFVTRGL